MYFSKDADSIPTFKSPWIHRGWTPAINPGISLEGMMLKLKLQYFGHLM